MSPVLPGMIFVKFGHVQSIRGCLSSRATSRLVIECIETAGCGSDDNVQI